MLFVCNELNFLIKAQREACKGYGKITFTAYKTWNQNSVLVLSRKCRLFFFSPWLFSSIFVFHDGMPA